MNVNIDDYDRFVVERNRQYLVFVRDGKWLKFSTSPYDAARLRTQNEARAVARKIGGRVAVFNNLTGDVRIKG